MCVFKIVDHKQLLNNHQQEEAGTHQKKIPHIDLGTSEPKWTGMGEFNSHKHHICSMDKNPLEEME